MRKWMIASLSVVVLVAATVVFGCSQAAIAPDDASSSSASTTYLAIVKAQEEHARLAVEAVSRYVDLPGGSGRSAGGGDAMSFDDIGGYLPDDLSTLTRSVPSRAAGGETEITLEQELDSIAQDFQSQLDSLLPDPTDALTLPFVAGSEDGLVIGGDSVIPYRSLEGAVTVEILNAMARGEDVEALVQGMERELEAEFGTESSRGVVKAGDGRWPGGVVNYRWGSITQQHKDAVLTAMSTWSAATGNRVSWRELPDNGWNKFQLAIYAIGVVDISTKDLPSGTNGWANVGYGGGHRICEIDISTTTPQSLQRVPLHELGHVLGLYHEHQRWNRDEYIIVKNASDGVNYGKIPKEISGWRWEWVRIRIGWWTISIPYPCWWTKTNSYTTGNFDFNSIMLYQDFKVHPHKQHLNDGESRTKYNLTLSPHDIEMVNRIY